MGKRIAMVFMVLVLSDRLHAPNLWNKNSKRSSPPHPDRSGWRISEPFHLPP